MQDVYTEFTSRHKSVLITGAPGTGKTTLCDLLVDIGYIPSPNHLSRQPRVDEKDGVHGIFIDEHMFYNNFQQNMYLEPDIDSTYYSGVYYGTPRVWLEQISSPELPPIVATPANTLVIYSLSKLLQDKNARDQLTWVNLYADLEIRKARIESRTHSMAQLAARLTTGVSQGVQLQADVNINTGVNDRAAMLNTALRVSEIT
ncbi:MAG: AAA family ATPase [Candidatus Saccharimonadales bacterium]